MRYPSPTLGSLPLPISLRSLSPLLAATFMPPRGRPTLVVLPPVASSSVASLSSASSCDAAAACRSLALAASPAFRRNSALLAAYFGPCAVEVQSKFFFAWRLANDGRALARISVAYFRATSSPSLRRPPHATAASTRHPRRVTVAPAQVIPDPDGYDHGKHRVDGAGPHHGSR